jgi:Bacterial pre-peptidase C-terminal domain
MPFPIRRPLRRRASGLALVVLLGVLGLTLAASASASPCELDVEDLKFGIPATGLAADQACFFGPVLKIDVPAGATNLLISSSGGTGDADLYVKFGTIPTSLSGSDYHSAEPGSLESVSIPNPQPGIWYVQVFPRASFSGVTLTADFTADETEVEDGVPKPGLADGQTNGVQYFTVNVPPGTANLDIATSGGTGNVDLLVRRSFLPTLGVNDAASKGRTNSERIDIASPQGGAFKVALYAAEPYSGVTLVVTLTPGGACTAGPTDLCLLNNRFQVEVNWINQHSGNAPGVGTPLPGTNQTGYFWFFNQENTELVVKMVDGRTFNGHFWFFYGGLSDVDYTIRVTDTLTGAQRTYHKPAGTLASGADTSAF